MTYTSARVWQWLGIIAIACLLAAGYWYFSSQASTTLNKSFTDSLTSGLVGYWTFDGADVSGTTATDRGSGGNNGTLTNSPTKTQGKLGQGLSFDGTNDYVTLGNNTMGTDLDGATQITFSAWIKPTAYPSSGSRRRFFAVSMGGGVTGLMLSLYNNSGNLLEVGGRSYTSDSFQSVTETGPSINEWHFVTGVFDIPNDTIKIYIDGVLVKTGAVSFGSTTYQHATSSYPDTLSSFEGAQEYFQGSLDEMRIYERELSLSEIKTLYDQGQSDKLNSSVSQPQGTGRLDSSLVNYWKFDENTGTSTSDSSVNALTGTLTNGPTWTSGIVGSALRLDGTNDYVTASDSDDSKYTGDLTLCVWANITTAGSYRHFMGKHSGSGGTQNPFDFRTTADNPPKMSLVRSNTDYVAWDGPPTTLGQWRHYCVVAPTTIQTAPMFYINGVPTAGILAGGTGTGTATGSGAAIRMGVRSDGAVVMDGSLDEARIYNRMLSANEIMQIYKLEAGGNSTGIEPSLKGYWSFNGQDMSDTTAYDRSGGGNNGTLTNSPTKTMGKVGQALSFDGTDDYTTVADANSLDITSAISMAVWIKTTDTNGCIMSKGTSSTDKCFDLSANKVYELGILSSTLYFQTSNGTTTNVVSGSATPLLDNQWHHVVGTWDGTTTTNAMKIYIDGAVTYQGTATVTTIQSTSSSLAFGYGSTYYLAGSIDEGRLYNRALSAGEIKSLFNLAESDKVNTSVSQPQGTGRLDSGLAGYWKMDDGSGTSATDSSTNGNTGTLTNGPTWTTGQIGGAVDFDGVNDYISFASNIPFNSDDFTIASWIYLDGSPGGDVPVSTIFLQRITGAGAGQPVVNLELSSTHVPAMSIRDNVGSAVTATGTTALSTGVWHHVTGIKTSSSIRVLVNGVQVASASHSLSGDFDAGADIRVIGKSRYEEVDHGFLNGKLDDIRVYKRALASDEVTNLYQLTSPTGVDTGLKGYWSFNGQDVSGTTAYDRSGSGNTGTISGDASKSIGKIGQGLSFGGTNGVVDMNDINAMDGVANVTLSAWMKRSAANSVVTVGKSVDQYRRFNINFYNDGNVYLNVGDGSGTPYGSFASNDTNWHHVVMVFDGSQSGNANRLKAYFDGVATTLTFSGTIPATTNNNSDDFTAGYAPSFGGYTVGKIDEVRLYNRSLTAAEVADLYNQSK